MYLRHNDLRPISRWAQNHPPLLHVRTDLAHSDRGARLLAAGILRRDGEVGVELTELGRVVGCAFAQALEEGVDRPEALRRACTAGGIELTAEEYLYCGATVDHYNEVPYDCNRRLGHEGGCSPDRDA